MHPVQHLCLCTKSELKGNPDDRIVCLKARQYLSQQYHTILDRIVTEEEGKQKPGITTFLLNFLSPPHGSTEQMECGASKAPSLQDGLCHWQEPSIVVHLVYRYLQGNRGGFQSYIVPGVPLLEWKRGSSLLTHRLLSPSLSSWVPLPTMRVCALMMWEPQDTVPSYGHVFYLVYITSEF